MRLTGYEKKRVLITGGAGCIGSNLARRLLNLGASVTVLDNLSAGIDWVLPDEVRFVEGSVTNETDLETAFSAGPELVIHLAALYGNLASLENPETDLDVNGRGTLKTLQWAKTTKAKRFVFASSGCSIYGEDAPQPLVEDQPPTMHYASFYQVTKLLGELYCLLFQKTHGLPTVRLRFFSNYGQHELPGRFRGVVPNFLYWALKGEPLPITGTGGETRTFTYVSDLCDGIARAGITQGIDGEAFNLAGGQERTINELAELVNGLTGNKAGVVYHPRRPWDRIIKQKVSIEKARTVLGYNPKTSLEDGIGETVEWFRANWVRIQAEARF